MQLKKYPSAIADTLNQIADLDYAIVTLKFEAEAIETVIESTVAFAEALKNDTQRKAKKAEMLQQSDRYQEIVTKLSLNQLNKAKLTARLEQLRGEFSVMKLQRKAGIVRNLTGLDIEEIAS
uniref:Uncharacterized protein n=1 Tax=Oscillatoriales cyanobacterium SpSt-402 TaxID=2282168 RepID=A0A832H3W8_9CYAN